MKERLKPIADPELRLIWKHTHRDFRGVIKGVRTIMIAAKNGGSELVPLDGLTLEERAKELDYAVKAEHREKMSKLPIGTKVVDRDGFQGVITLVTKHQGSVWYDVRFERGEAVRYPNDLTLI